MNKISSNKMLSISICAVTRSLFTLSLFCSLLVGFLGGFSIFEANAEPLASDAEVLQLKDSLVQAFNSGNINELLELVHPEVLVTWQNAEVSKGHQGVQEYIRKMMEGPNKIVQKVTANPKADSRLYLDNAIVSVGNMNDEFLLVGEKTPINFNSRFTAVIVKHDGKLKIGAIHFSVNAFDNEITNKILKTLNTYLAVGVLVIFLVGLWIGKKLSKT